MATVTFNSNEGVGAINSGTTGFAGSGIGFFGAGGALSSVRLNEYQDRTFISNAAGTTVGAEIDNVKFVNATGAIISRGGTVDATTFLTSIPNYKSTLNIRFSHESAVATQNTKFYVYDRSTLANGPSGVICKVAEIRNPFPVTTGIGSGDASWTTAIGTTSYLNLVSSPGTSGLRPAGAATTSLNHDWYIALSASPTGIGSQTNFGIYFTTEYL